MSRSFRAMPAVGSPAAPPSPSNLTRTTTSASEPTSSAPSSSDSTPSTPRSTPTPGSPLRPSSGTWWPPGPPGRGKRCWYDRSVRDRLFDPELCCEFDVFQAVVLLDRLAPAATDVEDLIRFKANVTLAFPPSP